VLDHSGALRAAEGCARCDVYDTKEETAMKQLLSTIACGMLLVVKI
jgi:hypothetical protein